MACNSSSNIKSGISNINASKEASRLIITISSSISPNINIGDVIRYDVLNSIYVKSIANGLVESEVVGIVESINTNSSKNVVIYGSINLPASSLLILNADPTGALGGNDIFFLSDVYSGKLQNIAPTVGSTVIKSIYQVAPHGSYSGIVINNIGYAVGGSTPSSFTSDLTSNDVGVLVQYISIGNNSDLEQYPYTTIPKNLSQSYYISKDGNIDFFNKYGTKFGYIEECKISDGFVLDSTLGETSVPANIYNLWDYVPFNSSTYNGYCNSVDTITNIVGIKKSSSSAQQPRTSINTNYWFQRSTTFGGSTNGGIYSNSMAYLHVPITFTESTVRQVYLPILSMGAMTFKDAGQSIDFTTNNINNIELKFVIKTEGNLSNLSAPSNSFVNNANINNLNIDGTDVNEKLLELENRLSYLESRLLM